MAKTVIAFDLFGTILSTDSIAKELAEIYGEDAANKIAPLARRYQLEYTWRCNSMGVYKPFDALTKWSFDQAISEIVGLKGGWPEKDQERIMNAYNGLKPYDDVLNALDVLRKNPNLDVYIFSNGTREMVSSCLANSQPAEVSTQLQDIFPQQRHISVDDEALQVYKPDRRTYDYVRTLTGMEHTPNKVWLVSSNMFDLVGASNAGLNTVRVDRSGNLPRDGLSGCLNLPRKRYLECTSLDGAVEGILDVAGRD